MWQMGVASASHAAEVVGRVLLLPCTLLAARLWKSASSLLQVLGLAVVEKIVQALLQDKIAPPLSPVSLTQRSFSLR